METSHDRRSPAPTPRDVNAAFSVTPFSRLARVQAGSTAGDAMVAAALAGTIFFAAATSDARDRTFLYLLLTMAPFAVVAPLIGPALDRARGGRRWVVVGTAVGRALLCFALIGRTDSWLLYPAAFGILVLQKSYGIGRSALVPAVVRSDEELVEANSKLQLLSGVMGFVGAVPAGLLFTIFDSGGPPLALAVCVFAATAGMALRLPKVAVAPDVASPVEKAELRSPGVLLAAGAMGLVRGIVGYLTLYYAFHFRETEELAAFGFIAAVSLTGTLLGSLLAPRLRSVWPEERMLISVLVVTFVIGLLSFVFGGTLGAAVLGGAVGIASTAGKLAFDSIVQRDAPDANRGRLFARFETRFQVIWVIGSMLGLIPLSQLRVSSVVVCLVAGFAAFTYAVGLAAWYHRTGVSDSEFGRQAVIIDQAMADGRARAKHRVRRSGRALVSRVRPGAAAGGSSPPGDGIPAEGPVGGPGPLEAGAGRPAEAGAWPAAEGDDATLVAGPGIGAAVPLRPARVGAAGPSEVTDLDAAPAPGRPGRARSSDPTEFDPAPPPPRVPPSR